MFTQISLNLFNQEFKRFGREDHFTDAGLEALFNYLEQYEEECGEQIQLDVIALCCDYTEYKNFKEIQKNYDEIKSMEDLRDNTQVIECSNGHIIIQNF